MMVGRSRIGGGEPSWRGILRLVWGVVLAGSFAASARCQDVVPAVTGVPNPDRDLTWQTVTNPFLNLQPGEMSWPAGLIPVWADCLSHPESDLRREVAESVILARRSGMEGLAELTLPFQRVLEDPRESLITKTSVAAAVVDLDCRDLAPLLDRLAKEGPPRMKQIVERGLAKWDYLPMREVWLSRLRDATVDPQLVVSAAEALAEVGEAKAVAPLSDLLLSPVTASSLRMAAARSLARLQPPDLVAWSGQLSDSASGDALFDARLGVELLTRQSSPEAIELMEKYVDHTSASVAAVALERLLALEPPRVVARAEKLIGHPDANLREITQRALAGDPTASSVALLGKVLDDRVPAIRRAARKSLLRHAAVDSLRGAVIERSLDALRVDSWRSKEQALIVLTELHHQAINDELPGLIDFPRPEVQVTAAWAMKHLYEADRAPKVLEIATSKTDEINKKGAEDAISAVQAHLFESLGLLKHRPATDLLLKALPKGAPYTVQSRASAIWALGFLLKPEGDAATIRLIEARLADANSVPMEYTEVRAASAIALGRIADPESLKELRQWYKAEGPNSPVGRSSGWAVMQMTGEPLPEVVVAKRPVINWFVEPLVAP